MNNEEEIDEIIENLKETEKKGSDDIMKYFNRIHDKLLTLNTVMIGGYYYYYYYYLSKIEESMPIICILIPLFNISYLIYLEYFNMETSRMQSKILSFEEDEIDRYSERAGKITNKSLLSICLTVLVFIILFYFILT